MFNKEEKGKKNTTYFSRGGEGGVWEDMPSPEHPASAGNIAHPHTATGREP